MKEKISNSGFKICRRCEYIMLASVEAEGADGNWIEIKWAHCSHEGGSVPIAVLKNCPLLGSHVPDFKA